MATATVANPSRFARELAVANAWVIDDSDNTAPGYERSFTVIRTRDMKRRQAVQQLMRHLDGEQTDGAMMAFVDSRRAVDEMAQDANRVPGNTDPGRYLAYRSGYMGEDRLRIEAALRGNKVRGVVTTSALEVGIDFSGIGTVLLEGVPADPSSFKQRAGRLRHGGNVIVVEDDSKLSALGRSVKDHFEGKPRQPILYRTNAKIQAEEALCLIGEMEKLGDNAEGELSSSLALWPAGFVDTVNAYRTKPTEELTAIQRNAMPPRETNPHLYHGLRTVDGPMRRLQLFKPDLGKSVSVAEVTQSQAIREALPGMLVHSAGRSYRVTKWEDRSSKSPIRVRQVSSEERKLQPRTRALLRTRASTYLNGLSVIRGALRKNGPGNFITSASLTIEHAALAFRSASESTSPIRSSTSMRPKAGAPSKRREGRSSTRPNTVPSASRAPTRRRQSSASARTSSAITDCTGSARS